MSQYETMKKFTELTSKVRELDKLTLEIMRHPEVRDISDKLLDICDAKLRVHTLMCSVVTKARAKYPDRIGNLPWNRPEYDHYYQPQQEN